MRDQEDKQVRDRSAHASRTFEECGAIDAWMPPLDFTIWQNEFQRLIDHLYAADVVEATQRLGRRPCPVNWPTTARSAGPTPCC